MLYLLRLILVLTLLPFSVSAADELEIAVQRAMEQARKHAARMELQFNKHQEAGFKAAKESVRIFNSPEFQEKIRCEEKRLKKEVFADDVERAGEQDVSNPGKLAVNEKMYLFFSSSIPDETIHSYMAAVEELDEPGVAMLMKGFVPGERHRYLIQIAKKDRSCVDQMQRENPEVCERFEIPVRIQPSLFNKYEVTQVPALVYERQGEVWKITGNARFDYLLEQINREAKSPGLESLIATLQRGKHE
ncbi:TrbC family F-type conjugative pilus assembly protein [Desulfogranum marinum]|uniref:TrbC family F-type conjugative pilus assembly protein n=1 Tax=Desulfogranum marinum TaxID=453220 RepID=UPI0029C6A905|nr:TrbC family F-type conjugative pilus assembly protein [Desulfogranum marinum]